jgi:hypothetical protein
MLELQRLLLGVLVAVRIQPADAADKCGKHCAATGCSWTQQYSCPWEPADGANGRANTEDGATGYDCCCVARTAVDQPCGGEATGRLNACFLQDKAYARGTMPNNGRTVPALLTAAPTSAPAPASTAAECQQLCAASATCVFFNFDSVMYRDIEAGQAALHNGATTACELGTAEGRGLKGDFGSVPAVEPWFGTAKGVISGPHNCAPSDAAATAAEEVAGSAGCFTLHSTVLVGST